MRVAVRGTGRMGGAMAATLRRKGFEVTVWNRTTSRAQNVGEAAGAVAVVAAGEAVADAHVVLSSLADDEAVFDAYTGAGGALSGLVAGQVVLEMSTVAPGTIRRLGDRVRDRGAELLDAPVSGSVPAAQKGELTI